MFKLSSRDARFYELFTASARHLVTGTGLLTELISAPVEARAGIADRMREAEHDADDTTHAIMRLVNETFVTPFDREDIYRLASTLDDVMDAMEAAVDSVVLFQVEELPHEFAEMVETLVRAAELTSEAMPRLRTMAKLSDYWIEINGLENRADQIHRRLLARLFSGEFDAMTVLKLKDVAEELEAAADAFEHVANTVESIAVKES